MVNPNWTIYTQDGKLYPDYATGDLHNITDGETSTFVFGFESLDGGTSELIVEDGETYVLSDGREVYEYAKTQDGGERIIEDGAQLVITGENTQSDLIEGLDQEAGHFVDYTTIQNEHKFRNKLPQDSDISSLLVGIEPSQELQDRDVKGIYGVVEGMTDNRNSSLTNYQYQMTILKLADFDEYSDLTSAASDLEV